MGVIYCANCEGKCSDLLDNCPHCGHPVSGKGYANIACKTESRNQLIQELEPPLYKEPKPVQTIELTSKRYKLQLVLSVLLIIVGIVAMIYSYNSKGQSSAGVWGILSVVFGFIWFLTTRIVIWWNHG